MNLIDVKQSNVDKTVSEEVLPATRGKFYSGLAKYLIIVIVVSTMLLSYLPEGNTINLGISIFVALNLLLLTISGKRPIWICSEIVILSIWILYAAFVSLFSIAPNNALTKIFTMFQLSVLMFLIISVSLWLGDIKPVMWAFGLSAVMSFTLSFTPLSGMEIGTRIVGEISGRTVGTLRNANTFGVAMVESAFIMACLVVLSKSSVNRIIALIGIMLVLIGVFKSGSRIALIGLVIYIFISAWAFKTFILRKPRIMLGALFVVVCIIGIGLYYYNSNDEIKRRYNLLYDVMEKVDVKAETTASSIKGRAGFAIMAWRFATSEKPFGIGLDNFKVYAGKYSHSNYMEILASTGFLGAGLYYSIYIMLLYRGKRTLSKNAKQKALVRMFIGYPLLLGIMDIANVSYYNKDTWITIAIMISSLELMQRNYDKGICKHDKLISEKKVDL